VLLMHGFTGNRIETGFLFVRLARALSERNIAAVTFDFLNSGESDGSFDRMLATQELADAQRMTHWLLGQPFADRTRLGVLGFSLGGLLASCLTARTDAYKARVLLAPTTSENIRRHATPRDDDEPNTFGAHRLHPRFFDDVMSLDAVADAARNAMPTLLVQGTGDKAVPVEVSNEFVDAMRAAGAQVDHELIDDADHAFARPAWRDRLTACVVDWVAATL
jgi:hypothetical protein